VVSQIKVDEHGQAYVIDADGRLIAHSDISLVPSNADMTQLTQVRAARKASVGGFPCKPEREGFHMESYRGSRMRRRECQEPFRWPTAFPV
jgi:hypothetical protein